MPSLRPHATRDRKAPILGPVEPVIDRILADDEDAPPKQRHTAAQIHRRLRDEHGYPGGYAQVQRYVLKHRRRHRETFIPLGHLPGRRLEADFGHIHVDFPDGRRPVPFLVAAWAYSNAPFVLALPFERTEAILEGMVAAFEFFGGVPREVWWDNPRTVATLILKGRERQVHPRYAALASHHVFEPRFCMPARGNEKPDAEGTVKAVQKRFATPVPRVADLDELNRSLRRWCEAERDRVVQSLAGPFTIGDRLAEDLAAASPLPGHRFEPCVIHPAVGVDKYQSVAFDGNRYSVPRPFAFGMVTVKGFVDRVAIVARGQVVATHARSPGEAEDDPRPAPLPGDAGPQARLARPRAGLSRLEAAGLLRRPPGPAGAAARPRGRGPAVRPGPATARRASPDASHARHRDLPARAARHRRGRDPPDEGPRGDRGREAARSPDTCRVIHLDPGRRAAARPEPVRPAPGRPVDDSPVSVFFA